MVQLLKELFIEALHQSSNMQQQLTRSNRMWSVFVVSQIIQNRRLATGPWTHEEHQRLGEDFGIAVVTIAQVAVLVHCFQWLDGVVVNAFQVLQDDVTGLLQCIFCAIKSE